MTSIYDPDEEGEVEPMTACRSHGSFNHSFKSFNLHSTGVGMRRHVFIDGRHWRSNRRRERLIVYGRSSGGKNGEMPGKSRYQRLRHG